MKRDRSPILEAGVESVFHTALLFSAFLLFVGHNNPGGGFIGGLVAAAAFILRYVDGGTAAVKQAVPVPPDVILGTGLLVAIVTGLASLVQGGAFLESGSVTLDLPLFGAVKVVSSLAFDIGVYLVVVGLALSLLLSLGGEPDA